MRKRHLCIISIILLLWSCNDNNGQRESLDKINEMSKSNPSLALTMLDSIDHSNLAEKERHYFDFITIKASKIAEKPIVSDSLMLDLMEYYSKEDRDDLLPEILFHAGILYSKLGDKPTALKYLQQSLDKLSSENSQKELRGDVITNIGELLFSIRLYGEAEPYITESFEMATAIGDSIKMMNHTYLLDYFYMFLAEPTRFQNSSYNYSLHERERLKAEERNAKLIKWLGVSIIVLLLLTIAILYLKYRNKSNLLKLHEALDDLAALKDSLNHSATPKPGTTDEKDEFKESCADASDSSRIETLKERLKAQLLELRANCSDKYEVPPCILSSEAYAKLQEYISEERAIPENSPLWNNLLETVAQCRPDFKYRLQLLTGGRLKPNDFHLAVLIKCGVTPTQLTILMARTKGTISYHRQALCMRIFNENLGANAMDSIIHLL